MAMRFWIILALIVGVLFWFNSSKQNSADSLLNQSMAAMGFDTRVQYRIGQIDPRFNMSALEVRQLAQEAADIWHQGTGKILLVENDRARLTINLIFDERQQESNLRHAAEQTLHDSQTKQQHANQDYAQRQQQLRFEKMQLDAKQRALSQQLDQYNLTVQSWNTLGNIDDYTRSQLQQQRQALHREQQAIDQAIQTYNQQVQEANQLRQSLNQGVDEYNQFVNQFNQRFTARQFEKGQFNGKTINIYEFEGAADLRLTIAHEMGHALGLHHNNDPQSLMYPMLKEQNMQHFQLRPADLAMLQ